MPNAVNVKVECTTIIGSKQHRSIGNVLQSISFRNGHTHQMQQISSNRRIALYRICIYSRAC